MITIHDSRIKNPLPAPIPTCLNSEPKFLQECIWSNTWVLKVPLFHPLCIRKHIREREFCEAAHGKTQFTLFFSRASCPQFIFLHYFKFHFCPLWISVPMWAWVFYCILFSHAYLCKLFLYSSYHVLLSGHAHPSTCLWCLFSGNFIALCASLLVTWILELV